VKMRSRAEKMANQPIGQGEMYFRIVWGISIEKLYHFSNSRAEKNL